MTEFETALELFIEGRLEFAGLQSVLARSLEANPASAPQTLRAVQEFYKSGRLPAQLYMALANQISPQEPAPPPGAADSGQFQSADPAAVAQDDGDKTRLKMPQSGPSTQWTDPPQQASDPTRATQTGASISQQQRATGPTGATGSSWGDPAQWAQQQAPTMQPGSLLKNRFVLENEVGKGGMGVVYRARDVRKEEAQDRNPFVAVKILNDEFRRHPESLKALQRESRKAQDLAHPNIVTVFDFDRDGAIVYMTMEFLEGESLDKVIKRPTFQGLPMTEAMPLITGFSHALAYAHNKGIVHSDFKPGNVFLTKDGSIKVFDFGIARAAKLPGQSSGEETKFDPGTLGALTPAYASCEMLDGETPDPRDDIYALACVSYELLTGRHPFEKRSAADARDKGLVPAQVQGLSRRQWRALTSGLAFRRDERSPDVETYLDELKIRKLNKTAMGLGLAAGVAVIAAATFVVPSYLQDRRIEIMVVEISGAVDSEIPTFLEELDGFDPEERNTVLADNRSRDKLIQYFTSRMTAAVQDADYLTAESIRIQALAFYEDSNRVVRAADEVQRSRNEAVALILPRFEANLSAGRLLPTEGEDDITDVLAEIELIDPTSEYLSDERLAIRYAGAAEAALAQPDIVQAARYIAEGQGRFPADARLADLGISLESQRDEINRGELIAELRQGLTDALPSLNSLEDYQPLESDIVRLEELDPAIGIVGVYRTRIASLIDNAVTSSLAQNDYSSARSAVVAAGDLVRSDQRAVLLERIGAAQGDYAEIVDNILARLASAADSGDLVAAVGLLAELELQGAAADTLNRARGQISRGYVGQARISRDAGEFAAARAQIEAGQELDAEFLGWAAELGEISVAEQLRNQDLADAERERIEQDRFGRVTELQARIDRSLASTQSFGIEQARETLAWIDELAGLDPGASQVVDGRNDVAIKLETQANSIGLQENRWQQAIDLLDAGIELIPAANRLRQARDQLLVEQRNYLANQAVEQEQTLRAELDRLVNSPSDASNWDADLRRTIQSLEPLPGAAEYLRDRRTDVARLYVQQAEGLLSDNNFDGAIRKLDLADYYVPQFDVVRALREQVTQARAANDAVNQQRERVAQIDALKREFTTQLGAARIDDAKSARDRLRQYLPPTDAWLATEAPRNIAERYLQVSATALADEKFDQARVLAQEGLAEVEGREQLTELKRQLLDLVGQISDGRLDFNVADLGRMLREAPQGDSVNARNTLATIRTDAGPEYADYLADLTEIADGRVKSSGANREELVNWVTSVFDNYVAPAVAGPPCTPGLAGFGRNSRGRCYDFLPDSRTEGPRLVVVPAGGDVKTPFAIARQEISVADWNAYCRISGNCAPRSDMDERVPITNVELNDVLDYASWLTSSTNHEYRLPTESEWVYAASAQTKNEMSSPNCRIGGRGDSLVAVNAGGGANDWGLMQYRGNAQEWASSPGGGYVARGGAYHDRLGNCTVETAKPHLGNADEFTGFRLVRELDGEA